MGILIVQSAASSGGGAGSGWFENVHSDYTSCWIDPLNGNDSNGGGSKLAAKKTIPAGSALVTGGGERLIIVPSAPIVLGADWTLPAGGSSNDARVVVTGEPEAEDAPEIIMGSAGQYRCMFSLNGARPFVTMRKLHMHTSDVGAIITVGEANAMDDFIGEYLNVHGIDWPDDDNAALVYLKQAAANRAIIRYCKLGGVRNDGSYYANGPAILVYENEDVVIHHCELYDAQHGVRWKQPPPNGHGPYIHHNIIHQIGSVGVLLMRDQEGTSGNYSGARVHRNLFYDVGDCSVNSVDHNAQTDYIDIDHNTFAEDAGWTQMELLGAKGRITNNIFATDVISISTKDPGSQANRILRSNNNGFRSGTTFVLGEYLSGTNRREYTGLPAWQAAKTSHNHVDLSELDAANPDLASVQFSSLTDTFTAHGSRDYQLKVTSSLKGIASDGGDPGYDPADCGPGW